MAVHGWSSIVATRSLKQNAAIHKYCRDLAEECACNGVTMTMLVDTLLSGVEITPTEHMVKEVFKAIQKVMFDTNSTTHLTTDQVSKVYETLNKMSSDNWGISIPFPSLEEQARESLKNYG